MNTVNRIAKNTILILISQIITYFLGFFIIMYTARYLGASGFGILSLALSITGIFGIINDMGLSALTVRELARNKSLTDKYLFNTAILKVFFSILTLSLIALIVNIIGYDEQVSTVVYIIAFSSVIGAFTAILISIFQANEKMEYVSLSNILNSIIMFLGTFIGIYYNLDILYFAELYIISSILVFIYNFSFYIWKFSLHKIKIDLNFSKTILKEAWPFGITGLSGMLYTYIDTIMLSIIEGNEVVGWYSAAYRIMLVALFIPTALNMAIFPIMSRLYVNSINSLRLMHEQYFRIMIIIGIPIGVGTTLLADKIILLVFGPGYSESVIALQILIWTVVITFSGAAFVQLLQSINKQLLITKISIICVILNIILNMILIPQFSYVGASVATLITEAILVGYLFIVCYNIGYRISSKLVIDTLFKVSLAAIVMSIPLWYFKTLNLFLLVFIGIVLYFVSFYLVKGINDMDRIIIKGIFSKTVDSLNLGKR